MIAKGNTHDNGARLARYIVTGKGGEFAELWELRGYALRDIVDAFRSVHVTANKSQCKQPFFHVQVRNPDGERLSRAQWKMTAEKIEGLLGLRDHPRAIAVHTDRESGHEHIHIAWSRIHPDTLKAKALPFFKLRLKKVCRELESVLGLTPVSNYRKGSIEYAPKRQEEQQAIRLGIAIKDVREVIRAAFERSDCGRSFQSALGNNALILARGDRRDFVAIDAAGGMHALGKRILGASAADIRVRLTDLSSDRLPSVDEARRSLQLRVSSRPSINEIPAPRSEPTEIEEGTLQTAKIIPQHHISVSKSDDDLLHVPKLTSSSIGALASTNPPSRASKAIGNKSQSSGLPVTLKRQFRAAVQAMFKRTSSPSPQARRRRSGEALSNFRMVARKLLRPIVRLPALSRAVGLLNDTLPWLHLWEWNETANQDFAANGTSDSENHPSPHP